MRLRDANNVAGGYCARPNQLGFKLMVQRMGSVVYSDLPPMDVLYIGIDPPFGRKQISCPLDT
jgi:hypothetical protein